ncbi:hypothetical protein [Phycicoccus sonneratiae]|uniref:Uncharacterized protein n=1 Tax=Phycicoccus sonneratiae TaxID=2807628 RepID=A0ABS2CIZ1_9MICO|nr:hypothetical protein [Phycicoccus sonneraticus]MBM6399862.1 hypothetical protein [Phycicoccus sonneraticus]
MAEPDAPEVLEDVDGDTVPRSRLRAAWGPPETLDTPGTPGTPGTPAPAAPAVPTPAARPLVADPPEPARAAERRTGPDLEHRIAPWAVPPASTMVPPAPPHSPAGPAPAEPAPSPTGGSASRARAHERFAPPRGAVDLAPDRATPLTDPPRRGRWPWRRRRG